jgi:acyl-CoA synthetase (AMP-forming)/AMP-acid ligase II
VDIWKTLAKAIDLYPDKVALVDGKRTFTYPQIGDRAQALARFLSAQGIQPGDRVSILEVNSHMFLESYYALAGMGAVLCPLNFRLSAKEIAFILNDAGAKWLFAGARFARLVQDLLAEKTPLEGILWLGETPDVATRLKSWDYETIIKTHAGQFSPVAVTADQLAHLYYTSGTTGKPKGVMLTHKNVCLHALATIAELQLVDTDIWGHIAAMFHLADAWATFAITWVGGRHVMIGQFEPETVMAAIEQERITLSNLIPTMLNLIIKHPQVGKYDFSSLRTILSGGAPIAPELVRSIIDTLGCDYIQTYGMTETSPYLTLSILKDQNGVPVAPDEEQVGEIWVRGDTITPGYWNRPKATAEAFHQGWLRTGDLAVLDSEGYVNIVDRKKDMIISGGENIYSTEVENVLYMHPKVLEAAVFGVPDQKWGEAVKAAVVLKPNETVPHIKRPSRWTFWRKSPRPDPESYIKKPCGILTGERPGTSRPRSLVSLSKLRFDKHEMITKDRR